MSLTTDALRYRCRSCGEFHEGLPAWHFEAPAQAYAVPEADREHRLVLSADNCEIDGREFYLKGLLELPVRGSTEPFVFGVWLAVSPESYERFAELFADPTREAGESFSGRLCNSIPGYPETLGLQARLVVREYPMRPWVELGAVEHLLAQDQHGALTQERAIAMAERLLHSAQ